MIKVLIILSVSLILALTGCGSADNTCGSKYEALSSSMKGYELYSWPVGGGWHFTLITGTNRNKSFDEIYWNDMENESSALVKVKSDSVETLKEVLDRLPEGERIYWMHDGFLSGEQGDMPAISFPGDEIISELVSYCEGAGLVLTVTN